VRVVAEAGGPREAEAQGAPVARVGPWRREVRALVELFAVSVLVVAQPTFEIFRDNAGVFVQRRVSPAGLWGFTLLVLLGPPLGAWLLEAAVGAIWPRARRWAHVTLLAAGVWFFTTAGLRGPYPHGHRLVVIGLAAAGTFAVAWWRFEPVRTGLRYAAVAGPVFAALFVFSAPVQQAVRPGAGGGGDGGAVRVRTPAPVVVLVLDEFPLASLLDGRGAIDRSLFPNFARLADASTWYRNATTVSGSTEISVPAMLTGRMPRNDGVATAANHPGTLFELLGPPRGPYRLNVHETITRLCAGRGCVAASGEVGRPVALWRTSLRAWLEFALPYRISGPKLYATDLAAGDDHSAVFERFVRSLDASGRTLHFAHVMLPHSPWRHLPDGRTYDPGDGGYWGAFAFWWVTQPAADSARLRHLLQVQHTDRLLGEMIDRLERLGVWDDALVAVIADHGVVFREDVPMRGVTEETYPDLLWVPMFVKVPGQRAGRLDDRPARTIDLAPTIMDALGGRLPGRVEGQSLLRPAGPVGPDPGTAEYRIWRFDELGDRQKGEIVSFDRTDGFRRVLASAAAPPGTDPGDPLRLYRLGPAPELVGEPVRGRVAGRDGTRTARIERPAPRELSDEDPRVPVVPAFVQGRVSPMGGGEDLVVAVNGRVAGWASSYAPEGGDDAEFWVSVPPDLLRPGRNDVAVYRLVRRGDGWELRGIPIRR
jgi:hypothetical protein